METKEIKINIPEGYEIDIENSTFECIKFKKKQINIWKDLKNITGVYISTFSKFNQVNEPRDSTYVNLNIFKSEKYAKSALALAQISQLMPYYGGEITDEEWSNDEWKYSISIDNKRIINNTSMVHLKEIIAFHTEEQRDKFLSFPENVKLIKDLYMVD
ncbi:hypothetical protein [uncultured Leptotrichia sp.]|uniref:hypothetical protein n=1 Tax=uncultured Leptotrichia sp. TaxID=159271 RepID=UPI0025E6F686|nr:hypothetical protein [uncultured Leptotrichia sp.]